MWIVWNRNWRIAAPPFSMAIFSLGKSSFSVHEEFNSWNFYGIVSEIIFTINLRSIPNSSGIFESSKEGGTYIRVQLLMLTVLCLAQHPGSRQLCVATYRECCFYSLCVHAIYNVSSINIYCTGQYYSCIDACPGWYSLRVTLCIRFLVL